MKAPEHRKSGADDRITDAAVEWALERKEGFTPERADAFHAWCEGDPRHARALAKAERTLDMLGELPALAEPLAARLGEEETGELPPARRRWWWRSAAWATAAAAAVALAVWWRWPSAAPQEVTYVSNAGRPQQVVLDDGSFVDLNAHTSLRTQMLPHERRIALREGEAHFAVAHDTTRPFIVEAGGVSVRAVGTAFNVRLSERAVEVLVLEGRVEISGGPERTGRGAEPAPQLGVAEQATIPRTATSPALRVEKVDAERMQEARSWHSTVTTISSRPLREIIDLFNRRNRVRIVLADPELGERTLGGSFPIDQPQAFVRWLELDGDVVSDARAENEIVLRRKR